ncbi:MAG: glycine cleavage system protein GcvH [Clostridia bacterium]|nr:glycine cleavage system protein GcvH [Clostridia bacterium]
MKYAKSHEWVKKDGDIYLVGITDYAQKEMGDIVYVELPEVGAEISCGQDVCELESVKAVAPVTSPVSGVVCEVNPDLEDNPALVNEDAENCWLYKVENAVLSGDLMDEEEYKNYLKTL